MSGATPWWGTIVVAAITGILTLGGVIISHVTATKRDKIRLAAEQEERARTQRAGAYAEHLAAHQRFIIAIDQFVNNIATVEEVEATWATLSTSDFTVILLSESNELVDGVDDLMYAAVGILTLVREGVRELRPYIVKFKRYEAISTRLGALMRQETSNQSYRPPSRDTQEEIEFARSQTNV